MQLCVTSVPDSLSCQELPCGRALAAAQLAARRVHRKRGFVLPEEVEPVKSCRLAFLLPAFERLG